MLEQALDAFYAKDHFTKDIFIFWKREKLIRDWNQKGPLYVTL